MATSVVAAGKFEIAPGVRGRCLKAGPSTSRAPRSQTRVYYLTGGGGGILPLGGAIESGAWKGFGLRLMVDILTGVLSGGHASSELQTREANHFFAAIRIDAFTPPDAFYDQMESMKAKLPASATAAGVRPPNLCR